MVKSLSTNGIAKRLQSVGSTLNQDERKECKENLMKWIKEHPRFIPTLWRLCASGTVALLEKATHREMVPDCNNRLRSLSKGLKTKWLRKILGMDRETFKRVEATGCDEVFYFCLCEQPDTDVDAAYVDELMWNFDCRAMGVGGRYKLLKFPAEGNINWATDGVFRMKKNEDGDVFTTLVHRPTNVEAPLCQMFPPFPLPPRSVALFSCALACPLNFVERGQYQAGAHFSKRFAFPRELAGRSGNWRGVRRTYSKWVAIRR